MTCFLTFFLLPFLHVFFTVADSDSDHQHIVFNRVCLYDKQSEEIFLFMYTSSEGFELKLDDGIIYELERNPTHSRNYWLVKIKRKIYDWNPAKIHKLQFIYKDYIGTLLDVELMFPFEKAENDGFFNRLDSNMSAIISTLVINYEDRLDEWIRYHIKLGFSGIVLFNNDMDNNVKVDGQLSKKSLVEKYKDKVLLVEFGYKPLPDVHWNSIQLMSLILGVHQFKHKCRWISMTDADEFIYLPQNPIVNIESFLSTQNTSITMQSNIITNKNNSDTLKNNVLELALYVGENKYDKVILKTDLLKDLNKINKMHWFATPHYHSTSRKFEKDKIIHYHAHMNHRCQYQSSMVEFTDLRKFLYDY